MRQFKQETYYVLSHSKLEDIIQHCFNMPSYVIAEGWENDSIHFFDIRLTDFNQFVENDIEKFKANRYNPLVENLLTALCARKEIPEGKYLIEVCY